MPAARDNHYIVCHGVENLRGPAELLARFSKNKQAFELMPVIFITAQNRQIFLFQPYPASLQTECRFRAADRGSAFFIGANLTTMQRLAAESERSELCTSIVLRRLGRSQRSRSDLPLYSAATPKSAD